MHYFKTLLTVLVFLVEEKFEHDIVPHERIELRTRDIADRFGVDILEYILTTLSN